MVMVILKRTDASHIDFQKLTKELDESLGVYYKEETSFYDALNTISNIEYAVVAYDDKGNCVGCGGLKKYANETIEIKRMFVRSNQRGKGIATLVLNELEKWATELHFKKSVLETLKEKLYAINFYKKNGYAVIPNFGAYKSAENSICFSKEI